MRMMNCFGDKVSCKSLHCKIVLLDEQQLVHEVHVNTTGQDVLNVVFRHLNLVETAYFGLRYVDSAHQPQWLDSDKKVLQQLKGGGPHTLYFAVKFYAVDPCQLVEELTRYQFFLQIKQDVLQGRLPVSTDLAAELAALAIQSELGDYDPHRHKAGYVSEFRFLAHQSSDLETKIGELHKTIRGLVPAVAEMRYLDRVKWLDLYGVDLHPVLGEDTVEYFLGLTPSGIIVLRNKTKVGNYFWPRISKVSIKARYFMLRVRDKNNDENTFGFETPSKQACKSLYKCCSQHLAFFRLVQTSGPPMGRDQSGRHLPQGANFKMLPTLIGRGGGVASGGDSASRSPPQFRRLPSRRHQRRIDGAPSDAPQQQDDCNTSDSDKTVDVASTANILSPYHSTSVGADGAESASVVSQTNRSHRSGRSRSHSRSRKERRSSSVESRGSGDSRSHRRHRHRSRHNSDNESDVSRVSESSRGSRRRRRHRSRDSSGSESDHHSSHSHRSRRHRRRDSQGSTYELVDSQVQWKEIQQRHGLVVSTASTTASSAVQQATVRKAITTPAPSGGQQVNHSLESFSNAESNSEASSRHRQHRKHHHRHHKHRSHSATPDKPEPPNGSVAKRTALPAEIVPHLHFELVDQPVGSNADQLREIPYQVVGAGQQQIAKLPPVGAPHVKDPPGSLNGAPKGDGSVRHRKLYQSGGMPYPEERKIISVDNDSPPPPYSPPTSSTVDNMTQAMASVNLMAEPQAPERPKPPTGLKPNGNLVSAHRAPPLPGPKPAKLRQPNGFGHFGNNAHHPHPQQQQQQQQQQQSPYHQQTAHLATSGPLHSPVQAGGGTIGGVHYPPQYNHPPLSSSSPVGPSPHQIGLPLVNGFTTSLPRVSMSPNPHAADVTAKLRPPPTVSPLAAGINSVNGHDTSTLTRGQKFVTRPQTPVKPQAPPPDGDTLRRPGVAVRPPTLTPTDDNHVTTWHASLPRRPPPVQQHRTAQRTQLGPHLQPQNQAMAAVATLPRPPRLTTPMTAPMTTDSETRHRRASSLELILSPMMESTLPRRSRRNVT